MKVFLSPLAERKIEILLDYLEEEWSGKVRGDFLSKLVDKFNQISSHPKSCILSQEINNLYKCVVTKQTSFFYRIKNQEIEIITIIDSRQNPNESFEEIRRYFRGH